MTKRKFRDATDDEMEWTPRQRVWLEAMEKMLEHIPGEARALLIFATGDGLTILGSCCRSCNDALLEWAHEARDEDKRAELH